MTILNSIWRHRDIFIRIGIFVLVVMVLDPVIKKANDAGGVETSLNRGVWLIAVDYYRPAAPIFRLVIGDNRTVPSTGKAYVFEKATDTRGVSTELSATEWAVLESLHTTWCENTPTYRRIAKSEAYYEVGVSCGMWHTVYKRDVPVDELPTPLADLFKRLLPATP